MLAVVTPFIAAGVANAPPQGLHVEENTNKILIVFPLLHDLTIAW